jgi:SRSO17 transposase
MIAVSYPKLVRDVCEDYAHLFRNTALKFAPLCAVTAIALFGIDSLCEGARVLPNTPSVSTLAQALKDFDAKKFLTRARAIFLATYASDEMQERVIYVVDDTPIPKAGKNNYAAGYWSTSSHQKYHGQKVLVLAAVDTVTGAAFPLSFRFALKSDVDGYKPAGELVVDLLDEILNAGLPKKPLVADSGFDSKDLIAACVERGVHLYVEMKCNRKVRHATARTIPKKKLSTYFRNGERTPVTLKIHGQERKEKYICTKHAYINGYSSPVKVSAVFNKRCGFNVHGYFLTTDMSADGSKMWEMSRHRWAIEVLFRDMKQHFSLGKLRGRSRQDAESSICIPFILVLNIRTSQMRTAGAMRLSRLETIGTVVTRIKFESLSKSIKLLSSPPQEKLRRRVAARRSPQRIDKKPINTIAGEPQSKRLQLAS